MKQQQFTLLELAAILMVLLVGIGVIMPVLAATGENAKALRCRSNLKDVFQAHSSYAVDQHGYFPGFFRIDGKNRTWSRILVSDANYLIGPALLSCPENTSPESAANRKTDSAIWDFNCYGFYAGNISADGWDYAKRVKNLLGDFAVGAIFSDFYVLNPARMSKPAKTPILADSAKTTGTHPASSYFSPRGFYQDGAVNLLHDGKANMVSADGAVEPSGANELAASPMQFSVFVSQQFAKVEMNK